MNPAQSYATRSVAPHALLDISKQEPEAGPSTYTDVKFKGTERSIQDPSFMTYSHEGASVVMERLLPLPERFGLNESAALKQSGMQHASVVNATVLPSGGVPGTTMVFGATGSHQNSGGRERLARLGAALLDQSVAHVVNVKHNTNDTQWSIPFGTKVSVAAQGGPLEVQISAAKPDGPMSKRFHIDARLPSAATEQSADIGFWEVNLSSVTPREMHGLLKALHEEAQEQTVAFGCQSGNSRSGAVAMLYHQRQQAEALFKQGSRPTAQQLCDLARTFSTGSQAARSKHFAERMPDGLLLGHAKLLEEEFATKDLTAPKLPAPPKAPKPAPPAKLKQTLEAPPKPSRTPLHPPGAPGSNTPSKSADSISLLSGFSGISGVSLDSQKSSDSHATAGSGGSDAGGFARLWEKPRAAPRQSHPYNLPKGQGTPMLTTAVSIEDLTVENSDSDADILDDGPIYDKPWASGPAAASGRSGPALPTGGFNPRASIRRMVLTHQEMSSSNIYSTAEPISEAETAEHADSIGSTHGLQSWQTGQHPQSAELKRYLHGLAQTFSQEAKQGLRLFASKNTYGVGLAIQSVKEEARQSLWSNLAQSLEETMSQSTSVGSNLTFAVLSAVMKENLSKEFSNLDPKRRDCWLRRTGKSELTGAIKELGQELENLQKDVDQGNLTQVQLGIRAQTLNLMQLSLNALYQVGTDPKIAR